MEAKFQEAAEFVRTFKPSKTVPNDAKLKAYGLFKQATTGDCNIDRPGGFFDFEGKAKWDAWNALKGKSKEDAMREYVDEVESQKSNYA